MSSKEPERPPFQGVEIDDIDARLEKKASEKGIPTLVKTKPGIAESQKESTVKKEEGGKQADATPRSAMKTLNIDLPDYLWVELKLQAARKMISVRHLVMTMLRESGYDIKEVDMIEDGRRLRGRNAVADE